MHSSIRALAVSSLIALVGCDDGGDINSPPVIRKLDVPTEVTATNGTYTFSANIVFDDADLEPMSKVRFISTSLKLDESQPFTGTGPNAQINVSIPAGTLAGRTYDFAFSIFDTRGAESFPAETTVSFK